MTTLTSYENKQKRALFRCLLKTVANTLGKKYAKGHTRKILGNCQNYGITLKPGYAASIFEVAREYIQYVLSEREKYEPYWIKRKDETSCLVSWRDINWGKHMRRFPNVKEAEKFIDTLPKKWEYQ